MKIKDPSDGIGFHPQKFSSDFKSGSSIKIKCGKSDGKWIRY